MSKLPIYVRINFKAYDLHELCTSSQSTTGQPAAPDQRLARRAASAAAAVQLDSPVTVEVFQRQGTRWDCECALESLLPVGRERRRPALARAGAAARLGGPGRSLRTVRVIKMIFYATWTGLPVQAVCYY